MNILPVIPFCTSDFHQAERLVDLISHYRNKKPQGYVLIVAASDTHGEHHERMRIAASVGFEHVGLLPVSSPPEGKNKYEQVNHLFREAAKFIAATYKEPFLWLEPDAVPADMMWLTSITQGYERQPKLYMNPVLQDAEGRKIIGRVGVYPRGAANDIGKHFDAPTAFEVSAGQYLVNKSGKTSLIQHLAIDTPEDLTKVRADASIVHGDKLGLLVDKLLSEPMPENAFGGVPSEPPADAIRFQEKDGVMVPVSVKELMEGESKPNPNWVTPKIDGRTKAGRAARAKANG